MKSDLAKALDKIGDTYLLHLILDILVAFDINCQDEVIKSHLASVIEFHIQRGQILTKKEADKRYLLGQLGNIVITLIGLGILVFAIWRAQCT